MKRNIDEIIAHAIELDLINPGDDDTINELRNSFDEVKQFEEEIGLDYDAKLKLFNTINESFLKELGLGMEARIPVVSFINILMIEHKTIDIDKILESDEFADFIEKIV